MVCGDSCSASGSADDPICINVGESAVLLARLRFNDGDLITQATIESIGYEAVRGTQVVSAGPLDKGDVIHDALVDDDDRWTVDDTGYNFEWEPPVFDSRGNYRVVVVVTPVSGTPRMLIWEVQARG